MDGNGRWASQRGLERAEGHKNGAKSVRIIVEEARKLGVRYLTLYSFSTENWGRPKTEVSGLMELFKEQLLSQLENQELLQNQIRFRVIGDIKRLSDDLQNLIKELETITKGNKGLELVLALNYGSREEIVFAMKQIASRVKSGLLDIDEITEDVITTSLRTAGVPDPDLLIRTAGEMRISNFLLWQLAYSEIIVLDDLWPDFNEQVFAKCINIYQTRVRKFGKTSEQLLER
ncbi:MAG: di-trans,poly-cis-decaprenylcistransferase [Proteobacteria bacterium]|nr:di-trans,poly-cis-decaprenylcistransferase [Pseudomonadota bacterium]